jgi:chromatin remodeling complex protein RSC6
MPRKQPTSTKKSAEPEPVVAAPAAAEPVADEAVESAGAEEDTQNCVESMNVLITDLEKLAKITRGLANNMKKVKKAHERELKSVSKTNKGGKKKRSRDPDAPKRAPSGFNKPAPLSKDLCKFLGVDAKAELSRPAVTKQITKYIKDNKLQNESNKREIVPDKKLSKLLSGPTDGESLTFFNLQKYIKHHFPNSAAVKPAAAAATPVAAN